MRARRVLHKLKLSAELSQGAPSSAEPPFPTGSSYSPASCSGRLCLPLQRAFSVSTCDDEFWDAHRPKTLKLDPPCRSSKVSPANSVFGSSACHHLLSHEQNSYIQKRFMSTPKIKLKVDRMLDEHAEIDKVLRPIFKVRTLILRQESQIIKLRYLDIKRKHIGIAKKPVGAKGFLKRYPNMFEIFSFPNGVQQYCRLTKAMADLLEEERRIYLETEDEIVLKLRKLLMMSKDRRIKAGKLDFARRSFGFPADFVTRIVPAYPQYFRIVGRGPSPFIELAAWDEAIAISELEKHAKLEALKAGMGEIQTRGQPLEFKIRHSPGMFLKQKNLELLERWQKLPYVSPYQDCSWVPQGTSLAQKRFAAVMHEILSLTIEKRALMLTLGRFREEFGLPKSIGTLVNGLPGIFYVSHIGNLKTVFLREGYAYTQHIENHVQLGKKEAHIIEDHPLLQWKMTVAKMAWEGPRMYAAQTERANAGRKPGVVPSGKLSDSEEDEDDAASGVSDFDLVDSEFEDEDAEDECESEDDVDMQISQKQVKARKEIW